MTDSLTPICDLIERLLVLELSRGTLTQALEAARPIEAAMARVAAMSSGSLLERRERERLKKQRQRAAKREKPAGTSGDIATDPIILEEGKTQKDKKKERKTDVPPVPGDIAPADDWPADYLEQFWKAFPPYRRQAKVKVGQKLARIRASKITWATLFGGVLKFAATNPGEFAPAPMVWLNDGRWDREYGPQGGSNAKTTTAATGSGFSGFAARLRPRVADSEFSFGAGPPADAEPNDGSGDT